MLQKMNEGLEHADITESASEEPSGRRGGLPAVYRLDIKSADNINLPHEDK